MSWILNHITKKYLSMFLMVIIIVLFIFKLYIAMSLFSVMLLLLVFITFVYKSALKKAKEATDPFLPTSKIRNVKYLIIGDMYKPDVDDSYVQIAAPFRNLETCYEILRHTHSILCANGGTVVIALKKANFSKSGYTMLDLPLLHHTTVSRLIEQGKLPKYIMFGILLHFASYIKFLMGIKDCGYTDAYINCEQLAKFCKNRGYRLIYRIK